MFRTPSSAGPLCLALAAPWAHAATPTPDATNGLSRQHIQTGRADALRTHVWYEADEAWVECNAPSKSR
jgi:hypothetical protein